MDGRSDACTHGRTQPENITPPAPY